MLTREDIFARLRASHPHLAEQFGVQRIGVFGSFASGTAQAGSDVDLIVELQKPIGFKFIELVEYLEALLGRKVDVLTPVGLQHIRVGGVARSIADQIVYV